MYSTLWNALPLPNWARALIFAAVAIAVVVLLLEVVFPWVGPMMPGADPGVQTVGVD